MGRKQELVKNTAILTLGKLLTKLVNFFFLPLYTAILLEDEMGTYDLMVTYGTLLLPLVNWQFEQGLFRFMLDHRKDNEKQITLFSTVLTVSFGQCFLYMILFFLVWRFLRIENSCFLLGYVVLHVFNSLLMQFLRGQGKSIQYAIASFLSASATTILSVVSIVFLRMGLQGMYFSALAALFLTIFYEIYVTKCWKYYSPDRFDGQIFREVCSYSLPLIPNNLAWWVVNASDRIIVSHVIGLAANGIYAVANKFPNLFIQFYNIFNLSWTETVSLHFEDADRDEFLSETLTDIFRLFSSVCFCVVAVMPFLFPIMVKPRYADAYNHVLILLYGMLFRVLVGLYSCVYVAKKQAQKIATTSVMAALINIVVDLLLVHRIHLYAASISTLVAFFSMFVIRYTDVNRIVRMRIHPKIAIGSIVTGLICAWAFYCGNRTIQGVVLFAVVIYSVFMNRDMVKAGIRLIKVALGRGKNNPDQE